jgi:AcrR family transcriptional regulator
MQQEAELAHALLPPRATSDGTLRRIYEQALVLFAERGYHGVSVREIADACGIKASSIYAHLPSKEQILHDLVLMAHEEHRDALRDALLGAGSDPADQLKAVVGAHVRTHAEYALLATVGNQELRALSPETVEEIQAIRDEDLRIFTDVIERGIRLGAFRCPDPFLATAIIGSAGIRVAVWFPAASTMFKAAGPYTVEQVVEAYSEFALRMVL